MLFFRRLLSKLLGTWELIGKMEYGKEPNTKNVPKWVMRFLEKHWLQKGRSYYLRGRSFVYRIDVLPANVQGYENVYIYRKKRRRKKKHKK